MKIKEKQFFLFYFPKIKNHFSFTQFFFILLFEHD